MIRDEWISFIRKHRANLETLLKPDSVLCLTRTASYVEGNFEPLENTRFPEVRVASMILAASLIYAVKGIEHFALDNRKSLHYYNYSIVSLRESNDVFKKVGLDFLLPVMREIATKASAEL